MTVNTTSKMNNRIETLKREIEMTVHLIHNLRDTAASFEETLNRLTKDLAVLESNEESKYYWDESSDEATRLKTLSMKDAMTAEISSDEC